MTYRCQRVIYFLLILLILALIGSFFISNFHQVYKDDSSVEQTEVEWPLSNDNALIANSDNVIQISLDDVIKGPYEIDQEDPKLIKKIRQEYVFPPSLEEYNLTTSVDDPSVWQAQKVSELLLNKKKGFFIEAGANDGEFISNTLALEKRDGWEGLLVEADPDIFKDLTSKHRKALTVPACLSNTVHPKELEFQKLGPRSRLTSMKTETKETVVVQCFPIYSILLAIGRTKIDYFSLDVEGSEFDVLQTIPWDKVEITTISVEYDNIKDQKEKIRKFMESKGYSWIDYPKGASLGIDYIFYREDLLPSLEYATE